MVNLPKRSEHFARLVDLVVLAMGTRSALCIGGQHPGDIARALWRRGVDAHSAAGGEIPRAGERAYDTVVYEADPSMVYDDQAASILEQLSRLSTDTVFIWLWCPAGHDDDVAHSRRTWWEASAFDAGFRKHPAYYRVNDYEALNRDGPLVCIPLEKIPPAALDAYPLESLAQERGLHMDMLRDPGERSDAHVVRYDWACRYVKPGDRVLDAACGLGYGAHLVARLTDAASVHGVDDSEYAIDYARRMYGSPAATFERGMLPQALARFAEGSFDTIISFETLEHVEDPAAVLREFHRLLTPGGRIIVSVPNDWSDESGEDPNPYHLHVYDWTRLRRELGADFIVEDAFAQTASQCKVRDRGNAWIRQPRSLRPVPLVDAAPADCEWWLMTAMRSPLEGGQRYVERVFANIAASGHASVAYAEHFANPWLMHAMVNVTYRMRNAAALEQLASQVLVSAPPDSNDYAAALCVKGYRVAERAPDHPAEGREMLELIDAAVTRPPAGPMGLRWKVSLLFVKARLCLLMGLLAESRAAFQECAAHDVRGFGIHLATRTSEAWFMAGKLAHSLGDAEGARQNWERGVEYGRQLLSTSLEEILIAPSFPNRFNHGDGVREYTVAWDNVARCANGLHLLRRGRVDDAVLENSFQSEYAIVLRDLLLARRHLVGRDEELIELRRLLSERTERLEHATLGLHARNEELLAERQLLVERTAQAGQLDRDLQERTRELVETRALLAERTRSLESAAAGTHHPQELAESLAQAREQLAERTTSLEKAAADLVERTRELEATGADLVERTRELEATRADLVERTRELEATRADLVDRTHRLEAMHGELDRSNRDLAERTGQFQAASFQMHDLNRKLEDTQRLLEERTARLAQVDADLIERTRMLEEMVASLRAFRDAPFRHAIRILLRRE